MFNLSFLKDVFERAFSTFCQGFVGAMAVPGPSLFDSVKIAGVAALILVRWQGRCLLSLKKKSGKVGRKSTVTCLPIFTSQLKRILIC